MKFKKQNEYRGMVVFLFSKFGIKKSYENLHPIGMRKKCILEKFNEGISWNMKKIIEL